MIAEYELTRDDWLAFNAYHQKHSPTARRAFLRAWLLLPVLVGLLCVALSLDLGKPPKDGAGACALVAPLVVLLTAWLLGFPWLYRRNLRRTVGKMIAEGRNRSVLAYRRVTISPESIAEWTPLRQSSTAWAAVERVGRSTEHVFVYVSALSAVIVPRRAFATPEAFEAFVQEAAGYWQKAQTETPPPTRPTDPRNPVKVA